MNERWSAGYVIGLPLACVGVTLVIGFTIYAYSKGNVREYGMSSDWRVLARVCLALSIGLLLGLPWAFFPWSAQYHRWVPKAGVVDTVGARFTSGTDSGDTAGAITSYVVQLQGDETRYDCVDTRCALAHPGDSLTLSCIRAFVWSGVPGWTCNYVRDVPVGNDGPSDG